MSLDLTINHPDTVEVPCELCLGSLSLAEIGLVVVLASLPRICGGGPVNTGAIEALAARLGSADAIETSDRLKAVGVIQNKGGDPNELNIGIDLDSVMPPAAWFRPVEPS